MKKDRKLSDRLETSFGFEGGYVGIMSGIFDTLLAGLLWILCSLPIVTCGAASAALYHTIVRAVKEQKGYAVRTFWNAFKGNLKVSILPWTILLVLTVLAGFNLVTVIWTGEGDFFLFLTILYAVLFIWLMPTLVYYCAALSRFDMPASFHVKVALFMVIRNPGTTLILYVIFLMAALFIYQIPILALILPGPVAFLISEFMEKALLRHYPKGDQ